MTTPERIKKRQQRRDAVVGVLVIMFGLSILYFRGEDNAQDRCIGNLVAGMNASQSIRAQINEKESAVTFKVIDQALTSGSAKDLARAERQWRRGIEQVRVAREKNPVVPLPEGICD